MTTKVVQPVLGTSARMPALPQSNCGDGHVAASSRTCSSCSSSQTGMDLNRFMFSVIATSVGRRSIDEAPKKPTTPSVRSST